MLDLEPGALAPVIRLHPIRTLVVSRDLAFRQRAVTVLGELGLAAFAVASLDAVAEVVALVDRERPQVVVLDATGCAAAAATISCELGSAAPRVGVVVVAGRSDRSQRPGTLDKWGWAEELSRAVQHAYRFGNPIKEDSVHAHRQPC
ncbi:MAG: hypothetical protein QOJ35_336 [Solirubrobacteraceae bacterium]|nr:hypothetical protein [Solirubrobacteraceae bacterium]